MRESMITQLTVFQFQDHSHRRLDWYFYQVAMIDTTHFS